MNRFRRLIFLGASLALTQAQVAQAADCLSEPEVNGLISFALPSVLDGTIKACKPHLAADGYFATRCGEFVARYAARKDSNWPIAKAAFLKLGTSGDAKLANTMKALPDNALQPFVEAMASEMVGSEIKASQCTAIERGVRILSPLPPENTAELLTFVVVLSSAAGKGAKPAKASSLPICKTVN